MTRHQLHLVVTLPWLASAVVLLTMTRIKGETRATQLGLLGSAAICFSIGCLARTSLALAELSQPAHPPQPPDPPAREGAALADRQP
ncbi:MAG: hypothetical protein ACKOYK_01290 [Cyanobium sp.]